jgi:hypothetical protein
MQPVQTDDVAAGVVAEQATMWPPVWWLTTAGRMAQITYS